MSVRAMAMITLNGRPHEMEGATTVTALLEALGVNPKQVAVALNGEVVRRDEWRETQVQEGDAVEIVRAVGGGSVGDWSERGARRVGLAGRQAEFVSRERAMDDGVSPSRAKRCPLSSLTSRGEGA